MALAHTLTIALHILFAASWFGLALAVPALSRAVASGGVPQGQRVMTMLNVSAVLMYAFAMANWIIGIRGGLRLQYNAWPYHTASTLALILVVVQLLIIRVGWKKLVQGETDKGRKRLAMGIGIGHLLWLVIFVLMYVGRGVIAV